MTFITHAAYTRYLMPVNISEGIIYPESGEGSPAKMEYARNADSRSNLLDYNVNLNADLTRGFSLNAYATLGYSNISASSLYGNSESLRIDNSYRENNLKGIAFLTISKNSLPDTASIFYHLVGILRQSPLRGRRRDRLRQEQSRGPDVIFIFHT